MTILRDILYSVSLESTSGDMQTEVKGIAFDSRQVAAGFLFIAVKGTRTNGHDFIESAIEKGAESIVCEQLPGKLVDDIAYVQVKDSAEALGIIASNFFGNPSKKLVLTGVTGTNGKTTTVFLLHNLFRQLGHRVGMLSTVENRINEEVLSATHTTPDPIQLNKIMKQMVASGCTHCFMEVSSHAAVQKRIAGLDFNGAIFTNITHDHLDYHGTFENYINAKKSFFDGLSNKAFALVNVDDRRGRIMVQNTKARIRTFALKTVANYKSKVLGNSITGLEMEIDGYQTWFKLIGEFNAYNLLTVYAVAVELGEDQEEILRKLSGLSTAPGRFELVAVETGVVGIVDYAHTPDALKNVLATINRLRTGNEQVITIIGCGGDRDREKRPLMAKLAAKMSDKVIFTSDNPRSEDPNEIISEMEAGVSPANYKKKLSIVDRKEAIKVACTLAKKNDIILLAGKGHEAYQEINGVKHPFDDREILTEMLVLTHSQP
jgi:UDP-N-acetylmuramoyl-L-alanyl-D-glutamate--2,6-diaminopimelate ligase